MNILGIHDGHNASACLLRDGRVTHLVQEERFTGLKNQGGFPAKSVAWMLADAGLCPSDLDGAVLGQCSKTSGYTREEILRSYARQAHRPPWIRYLWQNGRARLLRSLGLYDSLKHRFDTARFADALMHLPGLDPARLRACDHHRAHAAAAYANVPWGDEETLVLTLDGSGDGLCATVSRGRAGRLERLAATPAGHSIGDIYARVTHLMGMAPLEHEYKLMGMAPYVEEERADAAARRFEAYLCVDGLRFVRRVPEPTAFIGKRLRRDLAYLRFDHIAAGLQRFFETLVLEWVKNALAATGLRRLALSGGAFMNVKANGFLARLPEVDALYVCPSCGDESLSLGAAQDAYAADTGYSRPEPVGPLYLGMPADEAEARREVERAGGRLTIEEPLNPPERVAELLAAGEIVARCGGRAEFGARALGNRSILADPSRPFAVRTLNQMIKMRDFWMPFAPVVLADAQDAYIENPKRLPSPHMMLAFPTRPERFAEIAGAVQSADRTARPQLLEPGHNPELEAMLRAFQQRTGRAFLLNTSCNIHGEPMVGTAAQAVNVLLRSGLRWLWVGNILVHKSDTGETP